jgi:F-type H+-transporting ATPase subunit epsilon
MPIRCEIVSQDRPVFEGDVDIVVAPGTDGEMGILPHHAPLLTTLKHGELRVRHHGQEEVFAISGGVMEVRPDLVTVLADAAEHADEIDVARAEEARRRAEETLRSAPPGSAATLVAEEGLRRSTLRLQVAQRRRRTPRIESSGSGS